MELDDRGGLGSVASGASVCGGAKAALGEAIHSGQADPVSGSPDGLGAFGEVRNSRQATETLRTLAREAQRPPFGPGETLPGSQEERLGPPKTTPSTVLRWIFNSSQNSSWLKRKSLLKNSFVPFSDPRSDGESLVFAVLNLILDHRPGRLRHFQQPSKLRRKVRIVRGCIEQRGFYV
jgi:hypothetical protein